jgi:hypothetical protein
MAVAVAAGATGQVGLETICVLFGIIAIIAYLAITIDRYDYAHRY